MPFRFHISKSGSTASKPPPEVAKPLYLVRFDGRYGHWGLVLLTDYKTKKGVLYNLAFEDWQNTRECSAGISSPRRGDGGFTNRTEEWDLGRKGRADTHLIDGALSTPEMMHAATNRVFRDFNYKVTHDNCQTFLIKTLEYLHKWNPKWVSKDAINFVTAKSILPVRITTSLRQRNQVLTDTAMPANDWAARYHASSSSGSYSEASFSLQRSRHVREGACHDQMPHRAARQIASDPPPRSAQRQRDTRQIASGPTYGKARHVREGACDYQMPQRASRAIASDPPPRSAYRQRDTRAITSDQIHGRSGHRREAACDYQMPGAFPLD